MRQRNNQAPWQSLGKSEAQMSPGTHVAHHCHPAKPLDEKILQRITIRNGLHGIGQQLDFKALLGDQPANQKVIRRAILDGLVTPETGEVRPRRDDGLPQGEFYAVQLPRHENPRIEIGNHADGLEMLGESLVLNRNVQAGHSTDLWITQRCNHGAQIIWLDANVAVVDHQHFIASLVHHTDQFRHFVVEGPASRTVEDSNLTFGEIAHQLLENGHSSIVLIADAENQLVIRVVLAAIARKIFVSFGIQAADGLQVAYRRGKIRVTRQTTFRVAEKTPGTVQDEEVVNEGCGS